MISFVRSFCLIAFLFAAIPGSVAQTPGNTSPAGALAKDEAELRTVVEKFFELYAKEDLEGVMKLWSEKSPDYAERKKAMAENFAKEDYRFSNLAITRMKVDGDKASLRASLEMKAIDTQTRYERIDHMVRSVILINEDKSWKIWRYLPATRELSEMLVGSPSAEQRQKLLANNKDLQTSDLVSELYRYIRLEEPKIGRDAALNAYLFTSEIAEQLNDQMGLANCLNSIGVIYFDAGKYSQALEYYQRSLQIREKTNDKAGISIQLNNIGNIYLNRSNYSQAIEYYQRSLKICEEISDKDGIAAANHNMGNIYFRSGTYNQAIEHYQHSLRIHEGLNNKVGASNLLINIGNIYSKQSNYRLALENYQRSLKIKEEIDDKTGMAYILNNIGVIYVNQGDYAKALESYNESLQIREKMNDRVRIPGTLGNIGNLYSNMGNYTQAMEYHQRSLKMFEEFENKRSTSYALQSIGSVHYNQGDYIKALEYYQSSLRIKEDLNDKDGATSSLIGIGNVHYNQGEYTQSLDFYQRSLRISEELNNKKGVAFSLIRTGATHYRQGSYALAVDQAKRATAIARDIGDTDAVFQAQRIEGRAHQSLKNLPEARRAFAEAIAAAEILRTASAGGELEKQLFFESKTAPYLVMSDLLVGQNETAQALAFAERAKARTLLDALQFGRINIAKAMTAQEREQEDKLRIQLVSLNAQAFREHQRDKPDPERLKDLEAQRTKTQIALEDFQTRLYASHPKLKGERGEVKPLSLSETQALLPDDKTTLLEFAVAEDKTLLFVLTKSTSSASTTPDLKVYTLSIKAKDLTDHTVKFRQMLANQDLGFRKGASALYDLLLKPARAQLQGKSSLIIAPDGPLWELPFQSLVSNSNRYLIEDAAISYAPSLTYLREMSRKRSTPSAGQPTLLALGNPALAQQTIARAELNTRGEKLGPLPMAEKEARDLANLYGATQSKVYIGAEALEERFKAEAGNYRILHLATHGVLNDHSPMYSYVLLSQAGNSEKEDGLLEAREIMDLDLKADLAVLSACETARGRVGAGEGVIGLTWALFVAGVPTTVVSQWKVLDKSTQQLMIEFHRQLKTRPAQGKAEALRQAALKVMKTERHPYHWAGFILVGDGR